MKRRRLAFLLGPILAGCWLFASGIVGHAGSDIADELRKWQYPGTQPSGGGSGTSEGPTQANAIMTTKDDLDEVVHFYETKTGLSLNPDVMAHYARSADGITNIFEGEAKARPLKLRVFEQHTRVYSLMLIISRSNEEKLTYINWSFVRY